MRLQCSKKATTVDKFHQRKGVLPEPFSQGNWNERGKRLLFVHTRTRSIQSPVLL